MTSFFKYLALGACTCALSSCLLSRPDAPSPRYITSTLPAASAGITSKYHLRLARVTTNDPFINDVLHFKDGELRADSTWKWSIPPHQVLERTLLFEAPAQAVQVVDQPGTAALSVELAHLALSTNEAGDTLLQATALVRLSTAEDDVFIIKVSTEEAVTMPLPGNLAAVSGQLMTELSAAIWKRVTEQISL